VISVFRSVRSKMFKNRFWTFDQTTFGKLQGTVSFALSIWAGEVLATNLTLLFGRRMLSVTFRNSGLAVR